MLKQVPVLGIWYVSEISTKLCRKARHAHTREWVFPSSEPAKVPADQKQTSLQAQCRKGAWAGTNYSHSPQIPYSLEREMTNKLKRKTMWWAHNERIPGERTCALNLERAVELGRAENTFQVEKNILSKKRKFTKREIQLWSQGRGSKTDWVFKSLDTTQWTVRLFETPVWEYFYVKGDEQDLLLTGSELPGHRILKFPSHLCFPYLSSQNYLKEFWIEDSTQQQSIWKCMQSTWITATTGRRDRSLGWRTRIQNALRCSVKSCLD